MNYADTLMLTGLTLAITGFRRMRLDDFLLLVGAGNTLIGAGIVIDAAPLGQPQDGTVNLTVGLVLLCWWMRRRGGRRRVRRHLGAKSAATRAVLVRQMREAAQPAMVPGYGITGGMT